MAETRKLTVLMDFQDGKPFSGWLEVRLNSASKTDVELVGPRVWQEIHFDAEGKAEADLYPNSALEEGTYYRAKIYASKVANGYKSKALLVDTLFTMPDEDAFLHDLAVIEPVTPSAEDVLRTIASEAVQAVASAKVEAVEAVDSAEVDAVEAVRTAKTEALQAVAGATADATQAAGNAASSASSAASSAEASASSAESAAASAERAAASAAYAEADAITIAEIDALFV